MVIRGKAGRHADRFFRIFSAENIRYDIRILK